MRILALLLPLTLFSSATHAETRIIEQPDQVVVEICGGPEGSDTAPPTQSSSGRTVTATKQNRAAFVDPSSAGFLREQIDEIRNELAELRKTPPEESDISRRERLQRLNERQQQLQQYSAELSAIRSQSVKRY